MERARERDDINKEGVSKGELGGSLRRSRNERDERWKEEGENADICGGISVGSNDDAALSSDSAATTAATNIETVEQTLGRGRDRVVVMRLNANSNAAGALVMKARVREKMIEEKGHGRVGEKRERVKRRRRDGKGSQAAPGDVDVIMMSLMIGGLKDDA